MRDHRKRYKGWIVCRSDPHGSDCKVARAKTEEEAREMVARLNAAAGPRGPLYWCEWWSTSSSLTERSEACPN